MACWLTTHYPHYPAEQSDSSLEVWSIFVPRRHRATLERVNENDRVAFYVVKHGRRVLGKRARPPGEQAIVCLPRVARPVERCLLYERYTNGRTGDYAWQRRCNAHVHGLLERAKLCDILAWSRKYYLRGLGGGAGLIEVPAGSYEDIERQFAAGSRT